MTDPNLISEFPWLRLDASPILGDSRPHTLAELLGKNRLWLDLYRDWLQSYEASYVEGLNYLTGSKARVVEYSQRLGRAYPTFYRAAGQLKDAVRKDPAGALRQFPWAPANAASLLGDARPRNFDALVDEGNGSSWVSIFRGWLAANMPFDHAESWLDWVLDQGSDAETWERSLDPTVEAFAHEIGRVKDRLRDQQGNRVQRAARQAGEVAEQVGLLPEGMTRRVTSTGSAGGSAPGTGATPPGGGAGTTARPGAQGSGTRASSTARPAVTAQLDLATPLVAKATELSRWVTWLAPRFGAFGGTLAEEVASLTGYQQLVDRDGAHLNAQIAAARGLLGAGADEDLYAALAGVRDAVYTLAWDVDLGYAAYFGGWPHHRLGAVAQAVQESGSAHLSFEASGPVRRIATDTDSVYAVVVGLLDIALGVVDAEVPGYGGRDSAQSWGAPEVAGARTEVAALIQLGAQWAAQQPFDEADEAALEQATQASFGIAHESFRQIVADFQ